MKVRVLAVASLICITGALRAEQLPSTGDLFDRYARADFSALAKPKTGVDLDRLRQAIEHDAESWLRRGEQRTLRRRQLIVATVALEAAHAGIDIGWAHSRRLVEWAATLLRKGAPDEGERRWHLAALSVMEAAGDHELLVSQQKLAMPRFPDDPHFLMALTTALEASTWPDPDRSEAWDDNDAELESAAEHDQARRRMRQPPIREVREKSIEYQRRTRMRQAITALEDLSNAEAIRAEALVRLGYLHLRLRNVEIAIEQFEDVIELSDDPFVVYLAQFLLGTAHEQQGDRANAVGAYRAALAAVPRAQSASMALASLLFLGDDREEAADLVTAAITPPVASDPWREYQSADARLWGERLARLHEAIR